MENIQDKINTIVERNKVIIEMILCPGYRSMHALDTIDGGLSIADKFIDDLAPFARKATFPKFFNARVVNAEFALAFLFSSNFYADFVEVVKCGVVPHSLKSNYHSLDPITFLNYILGVFSGYLETLAKDDQVVTLMRDSRGNNIPSGFRGMDAQIVIKIDLLNSTDHILNSVQEIVDAEKKELDGFFREAAIAGRPKIDKEVFDKFSITNLGLASRPTEDGKQKRSYGTIWPIWHEAYQIKRLHDQGLQESSIIEKVYNFNCYGDEYASKKTTTSTRKSLAKRLTNSAFMRQPLAGS